MADWRCYFGDGKKRADTVVPQPPPWRDFNRSRQQKAETYRPNEHEINMVNTALYLRRPLLVTGPPGSGKSSLIHSVAIELGLGDVLLWPINSRSTLAEGLYRYDAVARLRDFSRYRGPLDGVTDPPELDISQYLTLGPLGTALYPRDLPRALLIDEIDKSDIDLPNDLLHVFEEGRYEIPELARIAARQPDVRVLSAGEGANERLSITAGRVQATQFPFVVITSNGERDLPPAFLRRCLRLETAKPNAQQLLEIVEAHLGSVRNEGINELIKTFLKAHEDGRLIAIDQLLNAAFLVLNDPVREHAAWPRLREALLRDLNRS